MDGKTEVQVRQGDLEKEKNVKKKERKKGGVEEEDEGEKEEGEEEGDFDFYNHTFFLQNKLKMMNLLQTKI